MNSIIIATNREKRVIAATIRQSRCAMLHMHICDEIDLFCCCCYTEIGRAHSKLHYPERFDAKTDEKKHLIWSCAHNLAFILG